MAEIKSPRDILAEQMDAGRKRLVPLLAEMMKRSAIKEIGSTEERERFWRRALNEEQEQALWAQMMAAKGIIELVPGAPETIAMGMEVSKQVYPDRWDMAPAEGRDHESDQAEWSAKHARRGPPKKMQEQMEPAPPPEQPASTGEGY